MRLARHLILASLAASLVGWTLPSAAQDGLGRFERPYTNAGNAFGHGAWGRGDGTALPLPRRGISSNSYYEQPYGGSNTFGTGFWAAEYGVRTGVGGPERRRHSVIGDSDGLRIHDRRWRERRDEQRTRYIPYAVGETVLGPRYDRNVIVVEAADDTGYSDFSACEPVERRGQIKKVDLNCGAAPAPRVADVPPMRRRGGEPDFVDLSGLELTGGVGN